MPIAASRAEIGRPGLGAAGEGGGEGGGGGGEMQSRMKSDWPHTAASLSAGATQRAVPAEVFE